MLELHSAFLDWALDSSTAALRDSRTERIFPEHGTLP